MANSHSLTTTTTETAFVSSFAGVVVGQFLFMAPPQRAIYIFCACIFGRQKAPASVCTHTQVRTFGYL